MATMDGPVKSAGRVLEIIDYVSLRGEVTFMQLVTDLSLPRSSTHGLLRTLVDAGWLEHGPTSRRISLGLKAWQIGQRYDGHRLLVEKARPVMDDLVAQTGETVQMARLDGVENVYIAISPSPNPMRLVSSPGMRLKAHATGIGKALLSTLSDDDLTDRLRGTELPRLTPKTVTDLDELLRHIRHARDVGVAVDDEEYIDGCRCVAAPVTTEAEVGVRSAISVTMPTVRTGPGWPEYLYHPVRAAVERIRSSLGLQGPVPVD